MNTTEKCIKKSIAIICLLLATISYAQQGVNYQGVARDASNELLINADITLDLNIVKTSSDGEITYSETHNVSTDSNGVFSVVIGNGTPTLNLFEDINWAEDKHFLNLSLNGTEIGTTEFMSVPYTQAMGKWQAHKNGVTPKGTGYSIYIGDNAGENDDFTNNKNIGIGKEALQRTNNGYDNIAIGEESMKLLTDGFRNIAIGRQALFNTSSGNANIAIGNRTLYSNNDGDGNIALGPFALSFNTQGSNNIAFGLSSLLQNTVGNYNIALGSGNLYSNSSGNRNIALGHDALYSNTTGSDNLAMGDKTLAFNTEGDYNIAAGYEALHHNTDGGANLALGFRALTNNTTGGVNLALGPEALLSNTTGSDNVGIGANAGRNNISGDFNTFVGIRSGNNTTGSGNVFLGHYAGYNETGSNKLYIENTASELPLIYGEFDNEILGFNAKVGIGTSTPEVPLQVPYWIGTDASLFSGSGKFILGSEVTTNLIFDDNEIQARNSGTASTLYLQNEGGDVRVGGAVVHASDRRLKRNIADISYGLKDILQLRPTEYFWKGKTQEHKSLGLIAQEVDEVIRNVVTYDKEEDKYGVSYTELIPVLIKAIQEQEKIISSQGSAIQSLQDEVSELKASINNTSN